MSRENSVTTSSTEPAADAATPHCPICNDLGFVRLDVPMDDPRFGRLQVCVCRQEAVEEAAHQRLYRLSNLAAFETCQFDTFRIEGRGSLGDAQVESLRQALSLAEAYARSLDGWLVLMGGYGCGKTHLAAAIAHAVVRRGIPTLFLTVPDLLDWLRYAYQDPETSFEVRFEEIRNIQLLVLDDLGTQNATPWAQEKLFQVIDYRSIHRLPTVVTSNQELAELDGRIASRIQNPDLSTVIYIQAPDYRAPIAPPDSSPGLSALKLLVDRTFGNFSLREREKLPEDQQVSLEKAFRAAQLYAERPSGWLVLMGGYGCGKTHLAAAIGNYRTGMGEEPLFVVVPDLLDHLRSTFSPTSRTTYDRVFDEVRTTPLLVLDDLGTQSATPWAREKLYQIFNYRYNARLPLVITTAASLEEIDPRIRSRMLDSRLCTIHAILAPSYRPAPAAPRKPRPTRSRD